MSLDESFINRLIVAVRDNDEHVDHLDSAQFVFNLRTKFDECLKHDADIESLLFKVMSSEIGFEVDFLEEYEAAENSKAIDIKDIDRFVAITDLRDRMLAEIRLEAVKQILNEYEFSNRDLDMVLTAIANDKGVIPDGQESINLLIGLRELTDTGFALMTEEKSFANENNIRADYKEKVITIETFFDAEDCNDEEEIDSRIGKIFRHIGIPESSINSLVYRMAVHGDIVVVSEKLNYTLFIAFEELDDEIKNAMGSNEAKLHSRKMTHRVLKASVLNALKEEYKNIRDL